MKRCIDRQDSNSILTLMCSCRACFQHRGHREAEGGAGLRVLCGRVPQIQGSGDRGPGKVSSNGPPFSCILWSGAPVNQWMVVMIFRSVVPMDFESRCSQSPKSCRVYFMLKEVVFLTSRNEAEIVSNLLDTAHADRKKRPYSYCVNLIRFFPCRPGWLTLWLPRPPPRRLPS